MSPTTMGVVAASLRRTLPFDPAALSSPLLLRYDPTVQAAANNAVVTTITDQSAAANHGTKGGSGSVTYLTSGINSKPAWNIPAGAWLDTPTFTSIATTVPMTVFAIMQLASVGADRTLLASTAGFNLALGSTSAGVWYANRGGANASGGSPNTSPHRVRAFFAGSGAASTTQVWVDGTSVAGPAAAGTNAQTQLRFGATSSGFSNFTGKVGEVLIYRGALTGTEITNVESYLSTKWGI